MAWKCPNCGNESLERGVQNNGNCMRCGTKNVNTSNQSGFIEVVGALFVLLLIVAFFFAVFFVRFKLSNEVVSGIVYNTTNDRAISGATCFSVRAGENTYVDQNNRSSYCIPGNSPYKALVNKAAADKRVKVEVEAHKYFTVKLPWHVVSNVSVKEVK